MKENIIGRHDEQDLLQQIIEAPESRFVAVYGRRRVGKTYLIREYYEDYIVFQCAGLANSTTQEQLKSFAQTLRRYNPTQAIQPHDWLEAFDLLISYLSDLPQHRKVVFLDELPWMDTPGSNFIAALEHFWNGWASARRDIVLVVCGSATSWMINKLINNHGGLYGRLTDLISLQPFNLYETQLYLESQGIKLSPYEVAECYMILGGIPYYLHYLDSRLSLAQNIDRLMFNPNGSLRNEFDKLYSSLFRESDRYIRVVSTLSKHAYGLSRKQISELTGITSGSGLTTILSNLEACGFLNSQTNYATPKRNSLYRLVDFFSLFHLRFLESSTFHHLANWTSLQRTPYFYTWAGYSFELVTLLHLPQVKASLGISGVLTHTYAWRKQSKADDQRGAQIDLIIDRNDNTVTLCEVKFSEAEYSIDKGYEQELRNKVSAFVQESNKRKSVQLTMVTTFGLTRNSHSGVVQSVVTLEDLLK